MKQIIQNLDNGEMSLVDLPCPIPSGNELLIRSNLSLLSNGTERMLLEFGKAGYLSKARQQPEKVKQVVDKIKADGALATYRSVKHKLGQPIPMGYSNVGSVSEIGAGVLGFSKGERLVSNGFHSEFVCVSKNLVAKVPDGVSDEEAVFTVPGAIAMQGVRLTEPVIGETIAVFGLGLIGQLLVQILLANGCRVIGFDIDSNRVRLAKSFGAAAYKLSRDKAPVPEVMSHTSGVGVDASIIATATTSNKVISHAAQICRKRGRVTLVGVTGLNLSRSDFYEKELKFQVSCSYGPGRYDVVYEQEGIDYPIGYVRWTEQRNFSAVLNLMADKKLDVKPLISSSIKITDMKMAYDRVLSDKTVLGVLLDYSNITAVEPDRILANPKNTKGWKKSNSSGSLNIGFLGSGSYAQSQLMPAFKKFGTQMSAVISKNGISGYEACKKFGFLSNATDPESVLLSPTIDAVVIATRHDSHARFVVEAIKQGKHIFVEKPLCMSLDQLEEIKHVYEHAKGVDVSGEGVKLMVGFNRRFAPQIRAIKKVLKTLNEPKSFVLKINAGALPKEHWAQSWSQGGGRVLGEACHFIDLLRFLSGSRIVSWNKVGLGGAADDTVSISLTFADGSIGTIHYFSNGHRAMPKEHLEVFCQGSIIQLNNYKSLKSFGLPELSQVNLWRQNKGQELCVKAFCQSVMLNEPCPIAFDEILEVSRLSIEIAEQI